MSGQLDEMLPSLAARCRVCCFRFIRFYHVQNLMYVACICRPT